MLAIPPSEFARYYPTKESLPEIMANLIETMLNYERPTAKLIQLYLRVLLESGNHQLDTNEIEKACDRLGLPNFDNLYCYPLVRENVMEQQNSQHLNKKMIKP